LPSTRWGRREKEIAPSFSNLRGGSGHVALFAKRKRGGDLRVRSEKGALFFFRQKKKRKKDDTFLLYTRGKGKKGEGESAGHREKEEACLGTLVIRTFVRGRGEGKEKEKRKTTY